MEAAARVINGAQLFARFAFPPNALGYCGPGDVTLVRSLSGDDHGRASEMEHVVRSFAGAWPYLQLIGGVSGRDPLDVSVVEAYWLGNRLLDNVDTLVWGNSLDDRFRGRAGVDWAAIEAGLEEGGVPSHSFHVFCVYPWVGLLRSGMADQALEVLNNCRIRWGVVEAVVGDDLLVRSQPLVWDGVRLDLGPPRLETVDAAVDTDVTVGVGDPVALHWNYICQRVSSTQLAALRRLHRHHLDIVNRQTKRLAGVIER